MTKAANRCAWVAVLGFLAVGLSYTTVRDLERSYPLWPHWNAIFIVGLVVVSLSLVAAVVAFAGALKTRSWGTLAMVASAAMIPVLLIPSLLRPCCRYNENAVIANLRTIGTAEITHSLMIRPRSQPYGAISDLVAAGLLDSNLADGKVLNGYKFTVTVAADGRTYEASAVPALPGSGRVYYTSDEKSIHHDDKNGERVKPESSHAPRTNDEWALHHLGQIISAEDMFAGGFATMEELVAEGLLEPRFQTGDVGGFKFTIVLANDRRSYRATTEPISRYSGRYGFFITQDSVIRYSDNPALAPPGSAGAPIQ